LVQRNASKGGRSRPKSLDRLKGGMVELTYKLALGQTPKGPVYREKTPCFQKKRKKIRDAALKRR